MTGFAIVGDAKILATDSTPGKVVFRTIDAFLIARLLASLDHIRKQGDYLTNVLVATLISTIFVFST